MHTDKELMKKICVYPAFICGLVCNHRWTQMHTDKELMKKSVFIRVYLWFILFLTTDAHR